MARVVVVGAGFAGIEAVRVLGETGVCEKHDCLWVAPGGRFVFTPLVPALVSGWLRLEDIVLSIEGLARRAGFSLVDARVSRLAPGRVALETGEELSYDALLVAAGAAPAFYNVPGAEEHSIVPYTPGEAEKLRRLVEDGAERIIVVGAGFVGVEVAAEALAAALRRGGGLEAVLVDMLPEPLGLLGNPLASNAAREILEKMGARFVLGEPVVEVAPGRVRLRSGEALEGDAVVWTAGFRGPLFEAPREALARGWFLRVDERLRVPGLPGAYAAGDAAALPGPREKCPALKMAREAIRSGAYAARMIAAGLGHGEPPARGFRARIHGCAPQAGLTLGPENGLMILGKALAWRSRLPIEYHLRLLQQYRRLLSGG